MKSCNVTEENGATYRKPIAFRTPDYYIPKPCKRICRERASLLGATAPDLQYCLGLGRRSSFRRRLATVMDETDVQHHTGLFLSGSARKRMLLRGLYC